MSAHLSLKAACALLVLVLASPAAATIAFINVNVISMTDEQIDPGQTVLIEDGRIAAIGPVDKTPLPK